MNFFEAFYSPPVICDIPSACAYWKHLADHFDAYHYASRHGIDTTLRRHYERAVELVKPQTICERLERYAKTTRDLQQVSASYGHISSHNRIAKAATARRAHDAHLLFEKLDKPWKTSIRTQDKEKIQQMLNYSAKRLGPPEHPPCVAEHPQFFAMRRYYQSYFER